MARAFSSARHDALWKFMREKREAAGLRQIDLAKRLKRNQSYVTNLERGQKAVEVIELVEWAEACGFDPIEIVKRLVRMRS
jgi:transcriptional regulator with XRE-family HTH domain